MHYFQISYMLINDVSSLWKGDQSFSTAPWCFGWGLGRTENGKIIFCPLGKFLWKWASVIFCGNRLVESSSLLTLVLYFSVVTAEWLCVVPWRQLKKSYIYKNWKNNNNNNRQRSSITWCVAALPVLLMCLPKYDQSVCQWVRIRPNQGRSWGGKQGQSSAWSSHHLGVLAWLSGCFVWVWQKPDAAEALLSKLLQPCSHVTVSSSHWDSNVTHTMGLNNMRSIVEGRWRLELLMKEEYSRTEGVKSDWQRSSSWQSGRPEQRDKADRWQMRGWRESAEWLHSLPAADNHVISSENTFSLKPNPD